MNKQEFCNALSAAFSNAKVCQSPEFWNFSVYIEEEPKWRFVLHSDYVMKIEANENSDNDIKLLSKLPHGYYSLGIDLTLPLDGSMGNDVKINQIPTETPPSISDM